MDVRTKERIATEEAARFLDGQFGQLDLSGSPDLTNPTNEKFEEADKHGLNRIDTSGLPVTSKLKEFLTDPDAESLARVADETGNPQLQEELDDIREEQAALEFLRTHPTYYKNDTNYQLMRDWLNEHGLPFDAPNLDKAFRALTRAGELETRPGTAKELSESEKLYVVTLVKNGQIDGAITQYLAYALGDLEERWESPEDFLSDPNTVKVRNAAVSFVFFHSRPIQPSPAWTEFQRRYFRLRPIYTLADLDHAWAAFQQQEKDATRNRIIHGNHEPTQQAPSDVQRSLDEMDDGELEKTYRATLRAYAKNAKAGAGVLV
jgi:hypothetical protein